MNKWEKPEINHGELTKFNYIVQFNYNLLISKISILLSDALNILKFKISL